MIIQTERLLLRPLILNDLYTTHQYVGDTENIKYMVYFPSNNLEETKEFISKAVDEWNKTLPLFYEFAVDELKVKRILACCDSKNTASYHIMEKLNFQLEDNTQERKNKNSSNMSKELIYSLVIK